MCRSRAVHEQVCELEKFLAIDAGFWLHTNSLPLVTTQISIKFCKGQFLSATKSAALLQSAKKLAFHLRASPYRLRENLSRIGFCEGHDFSRAAKSSEIGRALAPEVGFLSPKEFFRSLFSDTTNRFKSDATLGAGIGIRLFQQKAEPLAALANEETEAVRLASSAVSLVVRTAFSTVQCDI